MSWYHNAFDRLYPVLYPHRSREEARTTVESFAAELTRTGPVLDLACGDGRYLDALAGRGLCAWGLDLSEFLLGRAVREFGHCGDLVGADMRYLPLCDRSIGTVMSMFTSFGYFADDDDNRRVLAEVSRVLKPGGTFLLDFINAGKILRAELAELAGTVRESQGYEIEEVRELDDHDAFLVKHVSAKHMESGEVTQYHERLRLYHREQLEEMLVTSGLTPSACFGDYQRGSYHEETSDRLIVISEVAYA